MLPPVNYYEDLDVALQLASTNSFFYSSSTSGTGKQVLPPNEKRLAVIISGDTTHSLNVYPQANTTQGACFIGIAAITNTFVASIKTHGGIVKGPFAITITNGSTIHVTEIIGPDFELVRQLCKGKHYAA
jgi:hypothetical protein